MTTTMNRLKSICLLAGTVVLASCGGGGSATGGLTEFSVIPSSWTLTAVEGDVYCEEVGGSEITVTIVGGTPPYRLVNSKPQKFAISDTNLNSKNPTFKVVTLGGCSSELPILVLDNQSRSTSLLVTVEAGSAATTTP
jgi:hypothetical protein